MTLTKVLCMLVLSGLCVLIVSDAYFHFDEDRVSIKRQAKSAQRHWSIHYPQQYTYSETSFKYREDFQKIRDIITPGTTVLSDRATSYYLAAELPLYVKNVHIHHGRSSPWVQFIEGNYACYIEQERQLNEVQKFIQGLKEKVENGQEPEFKYWVFNSDSNNLNLREDCLAGRGSEITTALPTLAKKVYQGEYLWLYELY